MTQRTIDEPRVGTILPPEHSGDRTAAEPAGSFPGIEQEPMRLQQAGPGGFDQTGSGPRDFARAFTVVEQAFEPLPTSVEVESI